MTIIEPAKENEPDLFAGFEICPRCNTEHATKDRTSSTVQPGYVITGCPKCALWRDNITPGKPYFYGGSFSRD